ncbi:MAG TPA: ATP-binding protein [Candidatus Saccharimonadales bacterium]|nr:ATP-binding protein [Candidatus Saccharimonadales bacterium]
MLVKILSYFPSIIGLLLISFFVFINSPRRLTNRIFAMLNLFITFWLLSLFFGDTTKSTSVALWELRFAGLTSSIMFLLFYYFALVFPFKSKISIKRQVLYSSPLLLLALTSFSPLQVASVSIQNFGVQPEKIGPLYTALDFVGIAYLIAGIVAILLKYKRSDIKQKSQIKFVLFGLSVAIVVNIFTGIVLTLLKINTDAILLGAFSLFIFSLFVSFAIIKHGFLDIRLIVARSIAYVLTVAMIAGVYSVGIFGIASVFVNTHIVSTTQQIMYVILAVFLSFTFQPIKRFFDRLSNKLFYQDAYEPQLLLDELNKLLVSSIEINNIINKSSEIIQRHIKSEFVLFNLGNTDINQQQSSPALSSKEYKEHFVDLVSKIGEKVIVAEDLTEHSESLVHKFENAHIAVIAKLISSTQQGESIGQLVLGRKRSGNLYNSQDKRVISIIADELVIAIQNALRFEEIQKFNVTLQQEVENATHKLRRTNEKLQELDEAKDEFISMASHQLRTPLTSMKGYVSMVMEGDAGKVNSMQRKLLDQAFISSQRMVYLIADLLNVSRLKTGKFLIELKETNLAKLVDEEISQLYETAKGRKLELTYKMPKKFPEFMLDETKVRQVVMNFTDNAIYYTPAGGHINVIVENMPTTIEFRVEDNGLGVPRSEQPHLFTKFYRAGNARKARPDGTGLGLFMAKKVVIAQGGAIIFRSTEGKGSTFGFSFSKTKLRQLAAHRPPESPKPITVVSPIQNDSKTEPTVDKS